MDLLANVMGQKVLHRGALFRGINSTLTIPCDLFGVRISQKGKDFLLIEVITGGIDNPIKYQSIARPKVVQAPEKKQEDIVKKEIGQETLC